MAGGGLHDPPWPFQVSRDVHPQEPNSKGPSVPLDEPSKSDRHWDVLLGGGSESASPILPVELRHILAATIDVNACRPQALAPGHLLREKTLLVLVHVRWFDSSNVIKSPNYRCGSH